MANTPQRAIRISDELWAAAQARAEERGESVTEAIVRALIGYAKPHLTTADISRELNLNRRGGPRG